MLVEFLWFQNEVVLWVKDVGEGWPVNVILKALETPKPWAFESEPSINFGMVTFDLAGEGSLMHRLHIVEISVLTWLLLGLLDDVVSVPLEVEKILLLECEEVLNNNVMY